MKINIKAIKAVAFMASKEETRFYLRGVHVEFHADHLILVATDGHCLAALRQTLDEPLAAPQASVIIPLNLIARIKPSKVAALAHAELSVAGNRVTIDYLGDTFAADAVDGTFPNWRRIVPTRASGVAAQFDPEYPSRFAAAARVFSSKPAVTIAHNGLDAALVDWLPDDADAGLQAYGVMMPVRTRAVMTAPPAWAAVAAAAPQAAA